MEDVPAGRRVFKPDPATWGSLGDMLESLVQYTHLHDQLAEALQAYGLTIHEILDGIEDVDMEAKLGDTLVLAETGEASTDPNAGGIAFGPRARFWITKWAVSGFTAEQISILLSRTWWQRPSVTEAVEQFLSKREGPRTMDEQVILRLHREGLTPLEISRQTGYIRQSVSKFLKGLNIKPNVRLKRVPDEVRTKVIAMRNRGANYAEIRAAHGVTDDQIKSILRYAAQQGLLANYGKGEVAS